jgi:hypothetical protein
VRSSSNVYYTWADNIKKQNSFSKDITRTPERPVITSYHKKKCSNMEEETGSSFDDLIGVVVCDA